MAISRVGSGSAQATTISIPTHAIGDLIIISAGRNNTTTPTIPSGWVSQASASVSGLSHIVGWKIAKTTSETSGTWTNAAVLHVAVYRGSGGSLCVPNSSTAGATSTSINYASVATYKTGVLDNWYFAHVIQLNSANSLETAPTGMANINVESSSGVWKSVIHDTNASQLSNWSSTNVTVATSAAYRSAVLQIIEFDAPAYGGGFRPVNIRGGADQ